MHNSKHGYHYTSPSIMSDEDVLEYHHKAIAKRALLLAKDRHNLDEAKCEKFKEKIASIDCKAILVDFIHNDPDRHYCNHMVDDLRDYMMSTYITMFCAETACRELVALCTEAEVEK